ncbi:MAG: glycoside hydrolase family 3 protein [Nocardioides sp.]
MPSSRTRLAAACAAALLLATGCGEQTGAPKPTTRAELQARTAGDVSEQGSSGTAAHAPRPVETGWGPTSDEIARARRMVGKLSLAERAGQVIVASYDGTRAPSRLVNRLHLGGVVVFDTNITGAQQVRRSNADLQHAAAKAGRRWPVFIGVDQEGGIVERVTRGVTQFPGFMTAGAAGDTDLTRAAAQASGRELAGLGFTVDFAPDRDVTSGPADPTIGSRSASSDPRVVTQQADAASRGFTDAGVVPVAKHFPGHGSVDANSHYTLPVQHKSLGQLRHSDLVPFTDAVGEDVPAVMTAHLDIRAVDPGVPSSLSRKVVTGLLRDKLGFDGLAVTDALNMGAVTDHYDSAQAAVRALRAGEDVLLMPVDPAAARRGIISAVRDGRLSQARLDQAAIRQVALLIHQRDTGVHPAAPGSGRAASRRLSAAGITEVEGRCSGRLVGRTVRVSGDGPAVAGFRAAARAAGLPVSATRGTTVRLVPYGGSPTQADVVVATDTPYVLGRSRAKVAELATYGETPGAMRALVDVLLGRAKAPGHLPVPVAGVPRRGC